MNKYNELDALNVIATSLKTIADGVEQRDRDFASFAGLIHADLETLMYACLFAIPPLIDANPNIDKDASVELIQRVMELSQVHRQQAREATGWRKPPEDSA
jgi:hypothetical protein